MTSQAPCAYLGAGSNINPEENLPAALEALLGRGLRVTATSPAYATVPIGRPGQPEYRNAVWKVIHPPPPDVLKDEILRPVEKVLGRVRTADKYAPRTIDLDILLHPARNASGDSAPEIRARAFLAAGLMALDPNLPALGDPAVRRMLEEEAPALAVDEALTRRLRDAIDNTGRKEECPGGR